MLQETNPIVIALNAKMGQSQSGTVFWRARDLQDVLGYATWENFDKVVRKAMQASESSGVDTENQFRETTKMVEVGSGAMVPIADYFLSRYACYLIAMNGDSGKAEIGIAQSYFAVQTRRQEVTDQLTSEERRIQLRQRVRDRNKSLGAAAKQAGVIRFAVFQAAGYHGLYGMGLNDIKTRKGIAKNEDLLDRAGRTELAANEFRITQTEEKLVRDGINTEQSAIDTHKRVGLEVRTAICKLGGTMPENLPAETSIKTILSKRKKQISAKTSE